MAADPFVHLPHLRGRLKPAEQSELRVTPEVLAFWDQRARALGRPADWRVPDAVLDGQRHALLDERPSGEDLWVYAYGSLMWDPGFHFAELRLAELPGHQRRFSYRTILGRGTPQRPALMLALEPAAGACRGLVFRIPARDMREECAVVWRREMVRGGYCPKWLDVATPQGQVNALVFTSNTAHPDHVGELPLDEAAAIIAGASGLLGSNRDYLEQLAAQLDSLGIDDDYVTALLQRVRAVAAEPSRI